MMEDENKLLAFKLVSVLAWLHFISWIHTWKGWSLFH